MQDQIWTERAPTAEQIQEIVFPRLVALAERAWQRGSGKLRESGRHLLKLSVIETWRNGDTTYQNQGQGDAFIYRLDPIGEMNYKNDKNWYFYRLK